MNHFRSFPDSSNGVSGAGVAARRAGPVCDSQARSRPEAFFTWVVACSGVRDDPTGPGGCFPRRLPG